MLRKLTLALILSLLAACGGGDPEDFDADGHAIPTPRVDCTTGACT